MLRIDSMSREKSAKQTQKVFSKIQGKNKKFSFASLLKNISIFGHILSK